MSIADRWLLPDGVNEILPPRSWQIESLRRQMLDLFHRWGYDLVMPPSIEYLESLLTGTGNDLALSTYKVTDQLTGRLMGLRADTTPQVARIDAHSLPRDSAARYCYCNSILHTVPANLMAGRTPMQIGAELYGHAGVASDIEVISLMLETLKLASFGPAITLDVGHVAFYRALLAEVKLSEAQQARLYELLQGKELTELERFFSELDLPAQALARFRQFVNLHGDVQVLDQVEQLFAGLSTETDQALADLRAVAEVVSQRYPQVTLYFDLSELRGYNYHTGLVFGAFVPGYGQALAKGGRYDEIGRDFGRARPATGFSADLKVLAEGVEADPQLPEAIYAPADQDEALAAKVAELRNAGRRVILALPGDDTAPSALGCTQQLRSQDGDWQLVNI